MFSYFGSKSKIIRLYPPPKFDKIIEPFAGSARYSLKYWEKEIFIIDKYNVIVDIWLYLQSASKKDIMGLPKLYKGMDLRQLNLSEIEIKFLGFLCGQGSMQPRFKVSPLSDFNKLRTPNLYKNIADNLFKIKHWQIKQADYKELENEKATWFIDPPYQFGGEYYKESNKKIDYIQLAKWCKERIGHVIVCENTKANWLPFKPIVKIQGIANSNTTEAIWSNYPTNYDYGILSLF